MLIRTARTLCLTFLLALLIVAPGLYAMARINNPPTQNSREKQQPVAFKVPDGYMPADFPERTGKLLLAPKRPMGMFIVYPKNGESTAELSKQVRSMVAGMFIHDAGAQVAWADSTLPAHEGIKDESGSLSVTSNDKIEIQLASYTRSVGGTVILYGYFAMRNKGGKSKDDGPFLDSNGGGVKDFDKFWKTIGGASK